MIRIIADTTCGIPVTQLKEMGIEVLPQIVTFGNESYRDDTEMDTAFFLEKLAASHSLPGTAAPPPAMYTPIYERILAEGDSALVITPSQKLSGTFRAATVAAEELKDPRIAIVDTQTVAGGLGSIIKAAHQLANTGASLAEIKALVEELYPRERVFFLVNTLEYLHKGGRIGGASRLVGSLLQIKPILTIQNGQAEAFEKVRTYKQAVQRVEDLIAGICEENPQPHLSISHCGNEAEARALAQRLQERLGVRDIPIYTTPPAIVVHAGPGVLTASAFVKP